MTSPGALVARLGLGYRQARVLLIPRLLAVGRAPTLDADLAAGIRPSATLVHQLRADHLRQARVRRRIACALSRAVTDASRPARQGTVEVPRSREAIRSCHREPRALATSVATLENPRTQGVAIAFRLAFDGGGALFFQPGADDGIERLANTVQAAHAALGVSAEFDEAEGDVSSRPANESQTRKENRVMDPDYEDIAAKDLKIGFGILGAMVVVAVTIAIIASTT